MDWSITGAGVAWIDVATGETDRVTVRSKPSGNRLEEQYDRLVRIADDIEAWADLSADDIVVIEGAVHHARSPHRDRILAGWWLTAARLAGLVDAPPIVVAPTTLKKYTTGRGTATKEQMIAAVTTNYPMFDPPSTSDEADAIALAAIGARASGHPLETTFTGPQAESFTNLIKKKGIK